MLSWYMLVVSVCPHAQSSPRSLPLSDISVCSLLESCCCRTHFMMTGLAWILSVICVAGSHLSAASPVPRSARVVQVGQNASLTCNLTSLAGITWYLLRSDQLLPLLTVVKNKIGDDSTEFHTSENRIWSDGSLDGGSVSLEIVDVQEQDAGLYFCTGRCHGTVCVNRGIYVTVNGGDEESGAIQPCWSLGICVLLGVLLCVLLSLCLVFITGVYLCSGRPAECCWTWTRRGSNLRVTEDEALHYSSLRHADKPRPSAEGRTGLVRADVIYSAVKSHKAK